MNCKKTAISQISVPHEIVDRVFKIAFKFESTTTTMVSALRIIEQFPKIGFR